MPIETDVISQNKIAIVTGGRRGIGRNTVLSLAKRGVNLIFTYNSNQTEADKVVGLAAETGQKAIALQLDAGNVGAFDIFVQSVKSALKSLGATHFDYLVNNAGNNHHNMAFEKATEDELDSLYNVHFKGVFFLTQRASSSHQRRRTDCERFDSANAPHLARWRRVQLDEGGRRSAD